MVDVWSYNPLATDHLNGLIELDTPPGFEDTYGEEVFTFGWASSVPGPISQKLYFATNMMVYGLKAASDGPTQTSLLSDGFSVRLIDIDGVAINNTRVRLEMLFGTGEFPKPLIVPLWVPLGQFLTLEMVNQRSDAFNVQLTFAGIRRVKVAQ